MRTFTWNVQVTVNETWIADGFNPTAEQFKQAIMTSLLDFAYEHEVDVKILTAPDPAIIRSAQFGFEV